MLWSRRLWAQLRYFKSFCDTTGGERTLKLERLEFAFNLKSKEARALKFAQYSQFTISLFLPLASRHSTLFEKTLRNSITIEGRVLNLFQLVHCGLVFRLCVGWIELSNHWKLKKKGEWTACVQTQILAEQSLPFLDLCIRNVLEPACGRVWSTAHAKVNTEHLV